MIKPTIGRVVWVHRANDDVHEQPGIICHVHHDNLINVGGFDEEGNPFKAVNVWLQQEGEDVPTENRLLWAEWMPFQIGQAKAQAAETPR